MSQKNPQELQKMVEDLQKDVDALNRYVRTKCRWRRQGLKYLRSRATRSAGRERLECDGGGAGTWRGARGGI